MKLSFFILILIAIYSCSPDFHKQKYTNFGHGRNQKLKTADYNHSQQEKSKIQWVETRISVDSVVSMSNEVFRQDTVDRSGVEYFIAEEAAIVNSRLVFEDTLYLDSLEITDETSDTVKSIIYSLQLKREATRNLILSGVEIVIGVIAALTLPYWLPVMIIHFSVALVFLLIAAFKISKSNEVLRYPTKNKVRLMQKPSKPASIFVLSGVGLLMLAASILLSLLVYALIYTSFLGILFLIILFVILIPVALIALILILIAAIIGRNQTRQENLQNLAPNRKVKFFNALNWTVIVLAFSGIVATVSHWLSIN